MSTWPDTLKLGPLREWPGTRTASPRRSAFGATLSATLSLLRTELRHLGGTDEQLLMAMRPEDFRLDGRPRANAQPEHQGVILTVTTKHGPMSWPCDTFDHWHDNLRAISLALEALRKIDRYGVTGHGEQYRGFLAIEGARVAEPAMTPERALQVIVLFARAGNYADLDADPRLIPRAIRLALRNTHPDTASRPDPAGYARVVAAETCLRADGRI